MGVVIAIGGSDIRERAIEAWPQYSATTYTGLVSESVQCASLRELEEALPPLVETHTALLECIMALPEQITDATADQRSLYRDLLNRELMALDLASGREEQLLLDLPGVSSWAGVRDYLSSHGAVYAVAIHHQGG